MEPTSEEQSVMRKRTFKVRGDDDVLNVIRIVKREKFTGSIAIHASQGTVAAASTFRRKGYQAQRQCGEITVHY